MLRDGLFTKAFNLHLLFESLKGLRHRSVWPPFADKEGEAEKKWQCLGLWLRSAALSHAYSYLQPRGQSFACYGAGGDASLRVLNPLPHARANVNYFLLQR